MGETDTTEPTRMLSQNQVISDIMSREKCGQASNQGPCRRTQHSDHRCNDELKRPQIVRGWVFRGINSNPREYRSGHGSTHRKNDRQDAGFTNCAGSSGQNTDYNQPVLYKVLGRETFA